MHLPHHKRARINRLDRRNRELLQATFRRLGLLEVSIEELTLKRIFGPMKRRKKATK